MSAGQPNWQKLYEMGKLPDGAHGHLPMLVQLDEVEKKLQKIKDEVCDDCREKIFGKKEEIKKDIPVMSEVRCTAHGCDYVARGKSEAVAKSILRLHGKKHQI